MSGGFGGEEVGWNRRCVVGAWSKAIDAHQPPKRGERRDAIWGQRYEAIEKSIKVGCVGRVKDVGLTEAWARSARIISDPRLIDRTMRGTMRLLYTSQSCMNCEKEMMMIVMEVKKRKKLSVCVCVKWRVKKKVEGKKR